MFRQIASNVDRVVLHNSEMLRPSRGSHLKWLTVIVSIACLAQLNTPLRGDGPADAPRRVPLIDAGTLVEEPSGQRWNRLVLLAQPRLASGDVDSLTSSIRDSVASLLLTIMATVESRPESDRGEAVYRLKEVGVGYSMRIDDQLQIMTLAEADRRGVSLGLIRRQLLSENEKQLQRLRLIAQTSTLAIFDAPAIMLQQGEHRDFTMRHFVWIDARTGRSATLVWLLEPTPGAALVASGAGIRWVPAGTQEDRVIHVDGKEFFLGIPTSRAFALQDLPPGKTVAWTDEIRRLAARPGYSIDDLRQLSTALNAALHSLNN